ncbi:OLC1v1009877C1 [Oldenlandia corymbosa var. corymbosa]|uniref:OLC1v1009877C1 n=1 Tax=Oldenlandia corymbosa var. corymbosa TaxID=529605 RepID=A0AAV1DPY2_OLDCO|nr:OLC1v1009877C1 [Oldenlandia corymbosa var. corymbosa]
MESESIMNASVTDEDARTGELEADSLNRDSLEVLSSGGDMMPELESAGEVLTKVELELACFSEKLLNLDILVMHVASREGDFEAFLYEEENKFDDSARNAVEFDFLSGFLESELKEVDSFVSSLQVEIDNARGTVFSHKHLGAFEDIQEKLLDCDKSLKQSLEQVSEIKAQSDSFQRILFTSTGVKHGKNVEVLENGHSPDLSSKIKMQTVEQQRHILKMFEKSLARELDLEKKLTDLGQSEELLKLKLQQEVFCMEEEVEVVSEKFFEAENASEVFMRTSRELLSLIQILKFNLNGFAQREGEMRSKCEELSEELNMKDLALQNFEKINEELKVKCASLEKLVEESEFQLGNLKEYSDENKDSHDKVRELEDVIRKLKENISEAEKRAVSAEDVNKLLKDANAELMKDLSLVQSNHFSTSEKVNLLERQLRESDIKLQHAVASAEASEEKQTMLYSTIGDMENLIKDLKSKVLKAESMTDSAEEKCIILSETNEELNEEINFLRSRIESLEASLHQAEETKRAAAKNIGLRTELIRDLVMQVASERKRLHEQINLLKVEKKILARRVQNVSKDHSFTSSKEKEDIVKAFPAATDNIASATSNEEIKSKVTEVLATNEKLDISEAQAHSANAEEHAAEITPLELDTVRNIDPRELRSKYIFRALLVVIIPILIAAFYPHLQQ